MIRTSKIGLTVSLTMIAVCTALLLFAVPETSPLYASNYLALSLFDNDNQDITPAQDEALDNIDDELIYIDDEGVIRVLDTTVGAHGELTWFSPEGGFIDVATGDFNIDGDHEIVGVKNVDGKGKIVIYDPVISQENIQPDGWFGNVPWRQLDTIEVSVPINILDAGNLNLDLAGDEILVVLELSNGGTRVRIYSSNDQRIDGIGWQVHIESDFTWHWDEVAIGNIDGEKTDEVVLLSNRNSNDSNTSRLHIYRVDTTSLASKSPVVQRDLNTISWKSADIGEVKNLGPQEVVVVGDTDGNINNNIHVFKPNLAAGTIDYVDENDREFVAPAPDLTFLADVTGVINNQRDEELFFLRDVPASNTDAPHFFARNQGNDAFDTELFDLRLNTDNGWQAATGADVDGDAKDEIILMRNNTIRIYTAPDEGTESTDYENLKTDSTNIIGANLDQNGVREPLRFEASVSGLENGLETDKTGTFVINIDSDEPIDYSALLPAPKPAWITSLSPESGESPATLSLSVNTAGLNPGQYTTIVTISPSNPAARDGDIEVPITLNVVDNSFSVADSRLRGVFAPCEAPFLNAPRIVTSIQTSASVIFTAVILPEEITAAALETLDGPVVDAELNGSQLRLFDGDGNSSELAVPETSIVQASSVASALQGEDSALDEDGAIVWPSSVPWVFARSNANVAPSSLEIFFLPEKLVEQGSKLGRATLLVIADQDVVQAPFNTSFTPIEFLCADNVLLIPLIQQADVVAR